MYVCIPRVKWSLYAGNAQVRIW